MVTRLLLLFSFLFHTLLSSAQKSIQDQGESINSKSIYLKTDAAGIALFTEGAGEDNAETTTQTKTLALRGNYANIYFKWLNPLNFSITWKDSLYNDPAEQRLRDFAAIIANQMGISSTSKQNFSNEELKTEKRKEEQAIQDKKIKVYELKVPVEGFNSPELSQLFLLLTLSNRAITKEDAQKINDLIPYLATLDRENNAEISTWTVEEFDRLLKLKQSDAAIQEVNEAKKNIENINKAFKNLSAQIEKINSSASAIKLTDALLNSVFKSHIQLFLDKSNTTLKTNKEVVGKLDAILQIFDLSFENESSRKGYFKIRHVGFNNHEILQTGLTVSETTFNATTNEIKKGKSVSSATLIFRRYDPVTVSVSTGLFYGSTSIRKLGVAPSGDKFTIVEETKEASSAVTALFANLNIGLGSRFLSPLIQLGIDPTKPSPFLLLGGGFSIPAVHLSLTAGGIWTWEQTLNKLSLQQEINSSVDLEKDIKNAFQINPKGWYIGIQYNF